MSEYDDSHTIDADDTRLFEMKTSHLMIRFNEEMNGNLRRKMNEHLDIRDYYDTVISDILCETFDNMSHDDSKTIDSTDEKLFTFEDDRKFAESFYFTSSSLSKDFIKRVVEHIHIRAELSREMSEIFSQVSHDNQ